MRKQKRSYNAKARVNAKKFVLGSKIKRKTEGRPVWENRGE